MPEYLYRCTSCQTEYEIRHSIKDRPYTLCGACHQDTLERVIFGGIHASVRGEAKTIGQLADRNTKAMGNYELSEKRAKDKENKERAYKEIGVDLEKKKRIDKINKMTEKQKKDFIMTGKM